MRSVFGKHSSVYKKVKVGHVSNTRGSTQRAQNCHLEQLGSGKGRPNPDRCWCSTSVNMVSFILVFSKYIG